MCRYRVLGYDILVRTNRESLAERVRDIAVHPAADVPPAGTLEFELLAKEYVELRHHDCLISQHRSEESGTVKLDEFVAQLVLQRMSDCNILLHGGCASIGGRRLLVTGSKGSGITSLLMKLLVLGADVHSDGTTLLRSGSLLPFPRKFQLRDDTLALVPELIASCRQLRSYRLDGGEQFRFFDPTMFGRRWTVTPEPADAIFLIDPDFGSPSELEPVTRIGTVKNLMFQTMNLSDNPGAQMRELSNLAGTDSYRLRLGDLDGAAEKIVALLADGA